MKTQWQIQDEGGEGMHHHWRMTCPECGGQSTCRCTAPKTEATGICFRCCESLGIDYQTGLPVEKKENGNGMKANEKSSKCREILAPEPFDFKQPCEPPVVFLGGAIDMGAAVDWQKELVEYLKDVPCVALNPRRKDWDSSWKQEFENDQFREQVEWELKGLEQASLVVICLTKDSKAPISLLELGLNVVGNRMMVFCPDGFYRKGNVDVVCNKYGVPVFEDFEVFKEMVKDWLLNPRDVVGKTASDRIAWKMLAREFIVGMKTASMQRYCGIFKAVNGKWYLDLADQEYGEYEDAQRYGPFDSNEAVEKYLDRFSNPGGGVTDDRGTAPVPHKSPNGSPIQKPQQSYSSYSSYRWGSDETDPMADEKLSKLFMTFHTWATQKGTSLPPGAPVAVQIIDGLGSVTDALRGKMGLTGRPAVEELMKAMSGHFTIDAPPIPKLIRRYGLEVRDMARSIIGSDGETHPYSSAPLSRRPDYGLREQVVADRIVASARKVL